MGVFDKNWDEIFPVKKVNPAAKEVIVAAGAKEATKSDVLNVQGMTTKMIVQGMTTKMIVQDMERLVRGRGERLETDFVRDALRGMGYDPDCYTLTQKQRVLVHSRLVKELRQQVREQRAQQDMTSTIQCLLVGRDGDPLVWGNVDEGQQPVSCTVGELRRALGMPVEEFMLLQGRGRERALRRATHRLRRTGGVRTAEEAAAWVQGRTRLHSSLKDWNGGELQLERPQASSLHHLLDYDERIGGMFHSTMDDCQCVVVENNWGASVPPIEGTWRVPFPLMCWEFRISGVRVLAFTDVESGGATGEERDLDHPALWMVYGRDGHWVIDDFWYECGHASLPPGRTHRVRADASLGDDVGSNWEMRRVAGMVYACIRGVCIMREAEVAEQHVVRASHPKGRDAGGKVAKVHRQRDYYVVRLVNFERRAHVARSRGASVSGTSRSPQRGHWRAGTWVHFDDQDSGREQYVNDGGFIVSRTWRGWHFAGNPADIIHKVYKA